MTGDVERARAAVLAGPECAIRTLVLALLEELEHLRASGTATQVRVLAARVRELMGHNPEGAARLDACFADLRGEIEELRGKVGAYRAILENVCRLDDGQLAEAVARLRAAL